KLLIVWQLADHPLVQAEVGLDTTAYVDLARRVLAGDFGLGPGLYYVSPLYIYVLAAELTVAGSLTGVRVLQVLWGALAVGGIWMIAQRWSTPRAAWFAAGLATATGLITFYELLILQASIDVALTTGALLALTLALKRRDARWFLITGVVFGLASLNRPNMAIAAAGIGAMLVLHRRIRPAIVLGLGVLIGMAPVAIRNVAVSHQWSLVSSHGGLNFYIGNNETATGFYRAVPGIMPDIQGQVRDTKIVAEQALGRPLTDAEVSDYFMSLGWTWIREHPGAAARLFLKKLAYTFHAQHVALPYSYPFFVYDAGTSLRFYAIGPWLLIPLGLVGLVAMWRRAEDRNGALLWIAFVPIYAVSVAMFFVAERYRLPLLVPLCVGSGVALDACASLVSARQWKALAVPALAVLVLLGLANSKPIVADSRWSEGVKMAQRLVILNRDAEVAEWVRKLAHNAPTPGAVQYEVGLQYFLGNKVDRALAYLTEAQRLEPGKANIEYVLGQALLKSGHPAEALPHLRRGFEAGATVPVVGYDLAIALQATGDPQGAVRVIDRIEPAPKDTAETWLQIGRLAASVKAPQVGERFFRRGAELAPNDAGARLQYGLNLLVLNRVDEAAREFDAAVRLDPRDADALAHLAYCELTRGQSDDARRHADAALALAPGHPLASAVRAKIQDH
ncbi:MAG TPA: tetratricopeptide repeat protein, partial [Vicinamibacterales bacterium]|nr:tetratricopeptide repeat protein [Vicinamibacterales bacterium]